MTHLTNMDSNILLILVFCIFICFDGTVCVFVVYDILYGSESRRQDNHCLIDFYPDV